MVSFEVENKQMRRLIRINLVSDEVRIESGAMYYMQGDLVQDAKAPSNGELPQSEATRNTVIRPVVTGTGTLYLQPSYGEFTICDLNDESWVLDKGVYYASEMGVEVSTLANPAATKLLDGKDFSQTLVSGRGKVVIHSDGPLQRIDLIDDKLVVDGSLTVARSASLDFKVEKASKGIFSTMLSGEGLIKTFTGTGTVFICSV